MKILFIGDIVGKLGRNIVKKMIPIFVDKYDIEFVIANGENASHGKGLTRSHYYELLDSGVDCVTLGNHYANKIEIKRYIGLSGQIVRPINIIEDFPGEGSILFSYDNINIRVTNILGSAFINERTYPPYQAMMDLFKDCENDPAHVIHIVDFHGESTSEKQCFAYALDGQVSAIIGTHTHVQTRDYHVLPKGTAFISDVGMCGSFESVIGFEKESVVNKILFGKDIKMGLETEGKSLFSAVVIDVDEQTGLASDIFPIYHTEDL